MSIAVTLGLKFEDIKKMQSIEDIIKDCEQPECEKYSFILHSTSMTTVDIVQKKIFEFLSYICNFSFENEGVNKGLKSYFNFNSKSNEIPDIIDDLDIKILYELTLKINNFDILARIYDIIWCSRKNDYKSAASALKFYFESIKILVNIKYWPASIERIERAVILGKTINCKKILDDIIKFSVEQSEINIAQSDTFFAIKLFELLNEQKELKPYYDRMISICNLKLQNFRSKKDYYKTCDYCKTLARICHNYSDFDLEKKYLELLAETEIEQGEQYVCYEKKSFFNAVHHYQIAVEALKSTCNKEKYDKTYKILLNYQQHALSEMMKDSYEFDVSDITNKIKKSFEFLDFNDSMITFAKMLKSPTEKQIDNYIEEQKKYILSRIFPRALLDSKGRTIAIANNNLGEMTDIQRKQTAFEYFQNHWNLLCTCYVSIFISHLSTIPFTKADLQRFVDYNPLVEAGREKFFIDGLYCGFQYDFAVSLHLLIPQIENMFRYILNNNGILTTKMENGIQEEMDINQLLNSDEQRKELDIVFGKDIMLDFEGLLIARFGANLRNKLAHGLLSYNECFSVSGIYLWALILKVIILGWIITNKSGEKKTLN